MNTTVEAAVVGALNDMMSSYEKRNIDEVLSYFAPSPTVMVYGTGADEKRIGLDEIRYQIERDWAQSEGLSFNLDSNVVGTHGDVAWVASDITISGNIPGYGQVAFPARLTTVLRDYDGSWLIEHFHTSVPSASQEEGESF